VGAPIPENAAASRQEARLKHRLTKESDEKKRMTEKKLETKNQDSSDADESRARSIKKKAKPDAFKVSWDGKKTKLKTKDTTATLLPYSPRAAAKRLLEEDSEIDDAKDSVDKITAPSSAELSTKARRRLRRRLRLHELGRLSDQPTAPAVGPSSLGGDARVFKRIPDRGKHRSPSHSGEYECKDIEHIYDIAIDTGTLPAQGHKLPLLNLVGPPEYDVASDSSKKRRKRRYKRRK
jgi:hypothetical protein